MNIDLNNKIALVTGAATGIGASVAKTLAAAKATVIVTDLEGQSTPAIEVVEEIKRKGGKAEFKVLDISNEQQWKIVIAEIRDNYKGLDVLVNNAGVVLIKPVEEISMEELHWISRINIDGVFLGVKYALPLLKLRGQSNSAGASIINFSSAMGIKGYPYGSLYSMTKGAIRMFSKSIALEFAELKYNVRVNSVHPGLVDTAMVEYESKKLAALGAMGTSTPEEMRQAFENLNPMGRLGTPQELANAVLFLASDLSSFVTGSELMVDGGETAQ
ncbi:MAG: SDR family oxidoreductase [Proteobacteria bacterium]|nr:SDR family oxidoreductase [Pseudomonadota bacterium]NOG59570.1 SDR family oxidoreductase [Pseudomonadota bacterium]